MKNHGWWRALGGWWAVAYCLAVGQLSRALSKALFPDHLLAELTCTFILCIGAGMAWGKYTARRKP